QIGEKHLTPQLVMAFGGKATGYFEQLEDAENRYERELGSSLIEIYVPLYRTGTSNVIAVGEIYNDGTRLATELSSIRLASIGIVVTVTLPMMAILFMLVRRTQLVVVAHRASLNRKVIEAEMLAKQNDQFRQAADDARLSASHSNEQLLGRIGQ